LEKVRGRRTIPDLAGPGPNGPSREGCGERSQLFCDGFAPACALSTVRHTPAGGDNSK
jgi:hypothetical protein